MNVSRLPTKISEEQHQADHQLIEEVRPLLIEFLEDRKRARDLWEKFRQSMVGAAAVAIVAVVAKVLIAIGAFVLSVVK